MAVGPRDLEVQGRWSRAWPTFALGLAGAFLGARLGAAEWSSRGTAGPGVTGPAVQAAALQAPSAPGLAGCAAVVERAPAWSAEERQRLVAELAEAVQVQGWTASARSHAPAPVPEPPTAEQVAARAEADQLLARAIHSGAWTETETEAFLELGPALSGEDGHEFRRRWVVAVNRGELRPARGGLPP